MERLDGLGAALGARLGVAVEQRLALRTAVGRVRVFHSGGFLSELLDLPAETVEEAHCAVLRAERG